MAGLKQVIGESGGFLRLVKEGGSSVRAWSIPVNLGNTFLGWGFYVHAMRGDGSILGVPETVGTNLIVKANIVAAPRLKETGYPPDADLVLAGADGTEDDFVSAMPATLNADDLEIEVPASPAIGTAAMVSAEITALGFDARLILDLEADEDDAECSVRAWFACSAMR